MIVFCSMGGLGNQLFQYAVARRLAVRLGVEVGADTSWHERTLPNTTPRPFALHDLRVRLAPLPARERRIAWVAGHRLLGRVAFLVAPSVRRERAFAFDPSVLEAADGAYLFGYWQSPKYFDAIRPQLLEEIQPIAPPAAEDRGVLAQMVGCESVLVHVRRGDYVSLRAAASTHGTCSSEYYRVAFERIAARVRSPIPFVFSDDPAWAKENVIFPAPTVYVDHNPPDAAAQDLRLMASCRHAIVANSSFSWWGAWLGRTEGKVVVAPRRWFANGTPTPDLFPDDWILL